MDYIGLNIVWVIANAVLLFFYKTMFPKLFGSNHGIQNYSRIDLPILRDMFDTDAKMYLAIAIFVIFTLVSINRYKRDLNRNPLALFFTIVFGAVQMYFTITIVHF